VCFAQEGTTNPSKENEWVVKGKSRRRLTGSSERWRRDPELKAVAAVAGDASEQESGRCVCVWGERAYRDCWSTGAAGSGALSPESRAGKGGVWGRRRGRVGYGGGGGIWRLVAAGDTGSRERIREKKCHALPGSLHTQTHARAF
jgi:hypothetical protein